MGADTIVMLVGLAVAALIVVAWLVSVFRTRRQEPERQEHPAGVDPALNPWSGGNGGRW
ncbi:hypothetical protein [Nocardioides jejuensis]|uniref:hypothetical protein n=1 Tax=Nocardioides jejuensis TaxID=2502782 RepID=UPI001404FC8A|nr:hypothetical protein [Nocardioides jejuensis]